MTVVNASMYYLRKTLLDVKLAASWRRSHLGVSTTRFGPNRSMSLDQNRGGTLPSSELTSNCKAHCTGTDHLETGYRSTELVGHVGGARNTEGRSTACVKSAPCDLEIEKRRAPALLAQEVGRSLKDMLW